MVSTFIPYDDAFSVFCWHNFYATTNRSDVLYELQFDLARDVGLDYAPRQLFSSISFYLSTSLRRVYDKLTNPATMAKSVKITKMASNDNPHPTVLGSEGSIHINLHKEVLTGFEEGMKVFKGTYYRQVKWKQYIRVLDRLTDDSSFRFI